jgi:DNA-binding transcriptional regulator YiaG
MNDPISIKQFREARGWTQGDMANYFGVDKATVWRWENRGVPTRGPARQAIDRAIESLQGADTAANCTREF